MCFGREGARRRCRVNPLVPLGAYLTKHQNISEPFHAEFDREMKFVCIFAVAFALENENLSALGLTDEFENQIFDRK